MTTTSNSPVTVVSSPAAEEPFGSTLQRLLKLTDSDLNRLEQFLQQRLGCTDADGLLVLREDDFDGWCCTSGMSGTVPPPTTTVRKLLLLKVFMLLPGAEPLTEVKDFAYIAQRVVHAAAKKNPPQQKQQQVTTPTHRPAVNANVNANTNGASAHQKLLRINVGGRRFETTRETLCRVPGSNLEAMFSGRHENSAIRGPDGSYFIDRDGSQFHHVLAFLRMGGGAVLSLPRDADGKKNLAIEADFYGLDGLARAVGMPPTDVLECLDRGAREIWEAEERCRTAFRRGDGPSGLAPFHGLLALFSPEERQMKLPLLYRPPITQSDRMVPTIMDVRLSQSLLAEGQAVTVSSLAAFESNFNRSHPNILHRLRPVLLEEPVILAGGSVLHALTAGLRPLEWWPTVDDVDIFVHASTPEEASRIAHRIFDCLAVDNEHWVVLRSNGVITLQRWDDSDEWDWKLGQKIQIVLRLFESPAEVLLGFDCDCCGCCYSGREVWLSPRCARAVRTSTNILNPLHAYPNQPSYELRLAKYARRGYAVYVPGMEDIRIDHARIHQTPLEDLKGLARLVKISFWEGDIHLLRKSFYDSESDGIVLPSTFGGFGGGWRSEGLNPLLWRGFDRDRGSFPSANATWRHATWAEIDNAEGTIASVEAVPDRLADAWDASKRSREYINAESMDKVDWDSQYFDGAYTKNEK